MKKLVSGVVLGLVTLCADAQDVYLGEDVQKAYILTQEDGHVFMRSAPASNAPKVIKLVDETRVLVFGCETAVLKRADNGAVGKWCKVSARGKTGWVFSKYLNFLE